MFYKHHSIALMKKWGFFEALFGLHGIHTETVFKLLKSNNEKG